MKYYLVTGKGSYHMIRNELSFGNEVRMIGDGAFIIRTGGFLAGVDSCNITWLERCFAWDSLPEWAPIGDDAYYEGLLFGHLGSVTGFSNGVMTITTDSLVIKTSTLIWGMDSRCWYVSPKNATAVKERN